MLHYITFPINRDKKIISINGISLHPNELFDVYHFRGDNALHSLKGGSNLQFLIKGHISRVKKPLIKKVVETIFQTYSDYTLAWLDVQECAIALWDSENFKYLIELFDNINKSEQLLFVDNNLGYSKYKNKINYKQTTGMLGFNNRKDFEIKSRKFEKKFICLNRQPKPHRRDIIKHMQNFKDTSFLSFAPRYANDVDRIVLDDVEDISHGNLKHAFTHEYQKISFCNIVTETMIDSGPIHITEKVDKCFSAGQPFILTAGPHYLKKLKELGFKTFDKWWDESYDSEVDYANRLKKIKETITYVGNFSLSKCEKIYKEMIPILIHNQNHVKTLDNTYKYWLWPQEKLNINNEKSII